MAPARITSRRCAVCALAVVTALAGWHRSVYPEAAAAAATTPDDELCSTPAADGAPDHAAHHEQLVREARQLLQAGLLHCLSCDHEPIARQPQPSRLPLLAHELPFEFLASRAAQLPRVGSPARRLPGRA
ncbi:MAG: hypothetical protein RLZZ584_2034 [Pseudomonadota bacterium]|jgi:hypothetical protein